MHVVLATGLEIVRHESTVDSWCISTAQGVVVRRKDVVLLTSTKLVVVLPRRGSI